MTHLTNKKANKINDLPFWWCGWQVLASVLARKICLKSMTCHSWRKLSSKNGVAWILSSISKDLDKTKKKKESERERNWNVNKPYRNVNWKTAKLANGQDSWQFAHSSIPEHSIIILYIIFYIIYYRVTEFRHFFATFRPLSCYSVLLHVNCFANVTALSWQGEVMVGTLTNLTGLFLLLFKCKQIGMIYDALTLV